MTRRSRLVESISAEGRQAGALRRPAGKAKLASSSLTHTSQDSPSEVLNAGRPQGGEATSRHGGGRDQSRKDSDRGSRRNAKAKIGSGSVWPSRRGSASEEPVERRAVSYREEGRSGSLAVNGGWVVANGKPSIDFSNAVPVEVVETTERWNDYKLADGTVLRLKVVLFEVGRILGSFSDDGEPLYLVKSANVVNTKAPAELKRKRS